MCAIQQITNININLLLLLITVIFISFFRNLLLKNSVKNYPCSIYGILISGILFIIFSFHVLQIKFVLLLFVGLFILSLADIFYRVLPNKINGALLILGLILSFQNEFIPVNKALLGTLIGYVILWCISFAYKNITGISGLGNGDLKLTATLGMWIGADYILYLLLFSSLLGCLFYYIMSIKGNYTKKSKLPFGLFLSIVGISIFTLRFSSWCM